MRKVISILLLVVIIMGIFSSCRKIAPSQDATYTLRVPADSTGVQSWNVKYDKSGIVSHSIRQSDDEKKTEIVFSGVSKGTVLATAYLAKQGDSSFYATDVYVLELNVDRKGAVRESSPQYGSYEMNCGNEISGAEWNIEYNRENVHCSEHLEHFEAEGDGMQPYDTIYTFTGRHPGAAHILVSTYLPWCNITNTLSDEWLYVDSSYRVSKLSMTEFKSFRLAIQGMTEGKEVYEAVKTETGVKLSRFDAFYFTDSKEERRNETAVDGDETVYRTLAGLLNECGTEKWNGFSGSNPHVLDGCSFTFEAKLADGRTVSASSSNHFPEHYYDFQNGLYSCLLANKKTDID